MGLNKKMKMTDIDIISIQYNSIMDVKSKIRKNFTERKIVDIMATILNYREDLSANVRVIAFTENPKDIMVYKVTIRRER